MQITVKQPARQRNNQAKRTAAVQRIRIPAAAGWRAGETGTVFSETDETIVVDFGGGTTAGYPQSLFTEEIKVSE